MIHHLNATDIHRIAEIDRTELIMLKYQLQNGKLESQTVQLQAAQWSASDVEALVQQWTPVVESDGALLGMVSDDRLIGFAILRYHLTQTMAQLVALYVSQSYRRQGVAQQLLTQVSQLATAKGAKSLYVSAAPFESAVNFYLNQGFEIAHPHPELPSLRD